MYGERIVKVYSMREYCVFVWQYSVVSAVNGVEMDCEDKEMSDTLCIVNGKYRLCLTWIVKKISFNRR